MDDAGMPVGDKMPIGVRGPEQEAIVTGLDAIVSSCSRPFVLASEREISVLRRGLTKEGWKRALYLQPAGEWGGIYVGAGLLPVANLSFDTPTCIPAPGGEDDGCLCDCGASLALAEPLPDAAGCRCQSCSKIYAGEARDNALRYMQHLRLARSAVALALVHSIEKDRTYSDKAAEILLGYAQAYPGTRTSPTEGGMLRRSLCEAMWVTALAQAYDLIFYSRSLSDENRKIIERNLFHPVAEGLRDAGIDGHWGSWHLSAIGVIGLAIRDAALVDYALESFRSQVRDQLGDDGLWPGPVQANHFQALSAFTHFAEACYRAGIDLYSWQAQPGKSLRSMFAAPVGYMYPSFRLPAIGDGRYDSFMPLNLYEVAYRRWADPVFAWVLKKAYRCGESPISADQREHLEAFRRTSFYAFLFGRDLPGRSQSPAIRSQDYHHAGISTLRNGDHVMVTFNHGPCDEHDHRDKLSFTLYADGALLVPDYGAPARGSAIPDWYSSTAAHNTVVVDGQSQKPIRNRSLTARYSGAFLQFAEAVVQDHYPGVTQMRRVVLLGNACVVNDELFSCEERDYDLVARFEGTPEVLGDYGCGDLDCTRYPQAGIEHAYHADRMFRAEFACENSRLAFATWAHGVEFDVGLGSCPAESDDRKVPLLLCRQRGSRACFTAVLVSSQSGGACLGFDGSHAEITLGAQTDYVRLKSAGGGDSGSIIDSDADVAVVRTSNGQIAAMAIIRGTYIRWMGEPLLECPSRVDCVEVSLVERTPTIKYCGDTAGTVRLRTSARAMRVNGHKTAASNSGGQAHLRVAPHMLGKDSLDPSI